VSVLTSIFPSRTDLVVREVEAWRPDLGRRPDERQRRTRASRRVAYELLPHTEWRDDQPDRRRRSSVSRMASSCMIDLAEPELGEDRATSALDRPADDVRWCGLQIGWDVLDEDHGGSTLGHDSEELGDRSIVVDAVGSLVAVAKPFPRWGVGLAGKSRNDCIHNSAPRSSVEGGKVRPDRRLIQAFRFHEASQLRRGECFPLDVTNRSSSKDCSECKIVHSDAGTEGQNSHGT
jgi:hypothetical protein